MWVLLMVSLVAGEVYSTTKLEVYTTHEECESERARIDEELIRSYGGREDSGQTSWRLECRKVKADSGVEL